MNNPENAPAFRLAKEGFDVWLGNSRGTTPSRTHIKFDEVADRKDYWHFSW